MTAHQSTGVAVIKRTTQDGWDWPNPNPAPLTSDEERQLRQMQAEMLEAAELSLGDCSAQYLQTK